MNRTHTPDQWHCLREEILTGMHEWRLQHPKATLSEIEAELDTRLARMRARILEDVALQSAATSWQEAPLQAPPACPECGTALDERGTQQRSLQTHGGQDITLTRSYGLCPTCQVGFFPPG
jgi:hypothetical protein